jgi:hypothetical protein
MVAGDLVNTASRVQSAAEPGMVLVGDATRRAADAAIAYEDTGEHELKGKAEPMRLWRALRVVANRGGGRSCLRRFWFSPGSGARTSSPRARRRAGRISSSSPGSAGSASRALVGFGTPTV